MANRFLTHLLTAHLLTRPGGERMNRSIAIAAVVLLLALVARGQDILPKHITPQAQASIKKGLDYLAKVHSEDGSFAGGQDGQAYPVAMTSLAGMAFLANGNTP